MKHKKELLLTGYDLCPFELFAFAMELAFGNSSLKIIISEEAQNKIIRSADFVQEIIRSNVPMYGINTGFGKFAEVSISCENLSALQKNLILSHCCGVGPEMNRALVFCATLIRLNVICRGHSGTSVKTMQTLIDSLERRFVACVPSQGSVGASGDLAPSAHVIAALMGYGQAEFFKNGAWIKGDAKDLIKTAGLDPLDLGPKEGLSLINGTQFTAAYAVYGLVHGKALLDASLLTLAMSMEGLKASHGIIHDEVVNAHAHEGSSVCAKQIKSWLPDLTEIAQSHENCGRVQDPYSLRCAPQVHGALYAELQNAERTIKQEINCSTDNPLIFVESKAVRSGGNFHAIHSARVCDTLASALTTLSSICERRIFLAMSPDLNAGLPAFLSPNGGLNSGLMMAQVTAAALVSENKSLSFPASVDSIPTSDNKEDHVSMGPIAGKKLFGIIENTWNVLGIELLTSAQAIHLLRPLKSSVPIEEFLTKFRSRVNAFDEDRFFATDILTSTNFLKGEFLK